MYALIKYKGTNKFAVCKNGRIRNKQDSTVVTTRRGSYEVDHLVSNSDKNVLINIQNQLSTSDHIRVSLDRTPTEHIVNLANNATVSFSDTSLDFLPEGESTQILTNEAEDRSSLLLANISLNKELEIWDQNVKKFNLNEFIVHDNGSLKNNAKQKSNKKQYKDKKQHYCIYCKIGTKTLTRHLRNRHKNEPEVIMAIEEANRQIEESRKKGNKTIAPLHTAFSRLRKQGDSMFNETKSKFEQIVVRRNNQKENEEKDYVVCVKCKGYYSSRNFRHHRTPHGECKKTIEEQGQSLIGVARISSLRIPSIASEQLLTKIFPHFRKEDQRKIIFYDPVLIAYGNALCTKFGITLSSSQNYKQISSNLRLLADILIHVKKSDKNIQSYDDMLFAKNRQIIMEAIKKRCRFGSDGFEAPATALECCNLLVQVASLMQSAALDEENRELAQRFSDFQTNFTKTQNFQITRSARESRHALQRKKFEILPKTKDVKYLLDILEEGIKISTKELEEKATTKRYMKLAKYLLAFIMVFNRKRPADVHNWQVQEFEGMEESATELELDSIPKEELDYIKTLQRYSTRHKLNKNDAILLNDLAREGIKFLILLRPQFILDKTNNYIFAHPKGKRSPIMRADQALKDICENHNLKYGILRATKLRKHLASSTSDLPSETQRHLAAFMSHTPDIHFNIYQLRRATDVTVVGRILYHAAGKSAGKPITKVIDDGNQSIEEVPSNATWLTDDDIRDINVSQKHTINKTTLPKNNLLEQNKMKRSDDAYALTLEKTKMKKYDLKKKKTKTIMSQSWTTSEREKIINIFGDFVAEKRIPSLKMIETRMFETENIAKPIMNIQAWLRTQIKRNSLSPLAKRWQPEQTAALRKHFAKYYELTEENKINIYPSGIEIQEAIDSITQLESKTPAIVRAKIQQDFKHLLFEFQEKSDNEDSYESDV